jgi:hypothetical protein
MPKAIFKLIAKIKRDDPSFIDHINYITDRSIKKKLIKTGLSIERDYALEMLKSIFLEGGADTIPDHHRFFEQPINLIRKAKLGSSCFRLISYLGFYPSIELLISK